MPINGPKLDRPVDLAQLLAPSLRTKANDIAVVSLATRWTWRELDTASTRLAGNLLDFGLQPGDRIASLMPNRAVLLVHYLACVKAGLVATPLNYRYTPPEIDYALEVSGAKALVAHAERDQDLAKSEQVGQLALGVIRFDAEKSDGPALENLIESEPSKASLPQISSGSPICIFFTSGSTGKPKGVTHTFEGMGWILGNCIGGYELRPADVVLPAVSVSQIGGYVLSLSALAVGARVSMARTINPDELLALLRTEHPTVMVMLPTAAIALVRDHAATHDDFKSLRYCVSGGDSVTLELNREFKELAGQDILEGYGMTETGLMYLNPPSGINKIGSVGTLNPGMDASVRDPDGNEVPVGTTGRLWVRSRGNTIGYWNNPGATKEAILDGWLDTGDAMSVDADGYFWFRGRMKQIIVHDGSNISPQEVEDVLMQHDAVDLAGIVGVHNPVHGENVAAYVTIKPDMARPAAQELIQFARERIGYKAPETIVYLDVMPMNATGKIDRATLKLWAQEANGGS